MKRQQLVWSIASVGVGLALVVVGLLVRYSASAAIAAGLADGRPASATVLTVQAGRGSSIYEVAFIEAGVTRKVWLTPLDSDPHLVVSQRIEVSVTPNSGRVVARDGLTSDGSAPIVFQLSVLVGIIAAALGLVSIARSIIKARS
jgi:hypothetical protein